MITTKGKSIIAKYLLGQTPAYASYIALGCGPRPLDTIDNFGNYASKTDLDFEMFRVPVISKGYVTEGGVSKIVLTAELPTEDRYEITEIGIYSAGSNPSAGTAGSKMIFTFSDNEEWTLDTGAAIEKLTNSQISTSNNDMNNVSLGKYFRMNSDTAFLADTTRVARQERPRFLNGSIVLRGDLSYLYHDSGDTFLEYYNTGNYIKLSNVNLDLNNNSPDDEIRLAFSLLSKEATTSVTAVNDIKVMIEFTSDNLQQWARFNVDMDSGDQDFTTNRYVVASQTIGGMQKSTNFSWNAITTAKIYVTANALGSSSDEIYVALDALRVESKTSTANNPLYGLTGYTVIKDADKLPIVKEPNTSNFVEFRFAMDVV